MERLAAESTKGIHLEKGSVAIVGGGFSGTLLAINLLRHRGPTATLIERRPPFGKGVAYSSPTSAHLLNVRAANMSAFPDQPGNFAAWLEAHGLGEGASFASRRSYGDYLTDILSDSIDRDTAGRLRLVDDNAVSAEVHDDGVILTLGWGGRVEAETLVLATGNLPPHALPAIDEAALGDRYVADPWSLDPAEVEDGTVLLIGTGLTMVDVALSLVSAGFKGRIVALSRRGLLPQVHGAATGGGLAERPPVALVPLLRAVRARAGAIGWRAAIDELRPYTQDIWRAAAPSDQARFLRHLRTWWDVHRHRLAPQVAERLEALRTDGTLEIVAGRPCETKRKEDHAVVRYRPRGGRGEVSLNVTLIINCTGPQGDLTRTTEPLLRSLVDAGHVRADACRLGLDVDSDARLIGADGKPRDRLRAVGPMTRGAFWEITAVPDIRRQTWAMARRLSNAHWVEGEGL